MKEFSSLAQFGRHLARVAALGPEVTAHAAKVAGEAIKENAQARIGEYQDGVRDFPAWVNLAERTVADRLRLGFTPDDPLLRTGELRASIEVAEQEPGTVLIGSFDQVAKWQEVGTDKIPPRPFLGPAAVTSGSAIAENTGKTAVAWVAGVGWMRPRLTLKPSS